MMREELDLTALARASAAEIEEACERNCTSIEVRGGLRAHGDPKLVGLVLQNLLENACKFSPNGGVIEVGEANTGEGRAFFVRDQGIGFDMRHMNRLFQPFERLVSEAEFPGTGIGLANVQRIVQRHGGRVWAESQPGKGSTFWFTLE